MMSNVVVLAVFVTILVAVQAQNTASCVWYRSAPFCSTGQSCPSNYQYFELQADKDSKAQYCSDQFGSTCWSGYKILCCNQDVNLQYTNTYTCGSY